MSEFMSIPLGTRKSLRRGATICLNFLPYAKDPLRCSRQIEKTNKGSCLCAFPETVELGLESWKKSAQERDPYAKIFLLLDKIVSCGENDDYIWNEILSDILCLLSDSSLEMMSALEHSLAGMDLLSELRKIYKSHSSISNGDSTDLK